MAIPVRYAPHRGQFPYWLVAATAVAAIIAIIPIIGAIVAGVSGAGTPQTAFASAPAGNYAVVVRAEKEADTIVVVSGSDAGEETEIATVPHISGYTSFGAVSPTGDVLALVTADSGTSSRPIASLLVVELETARVRRLASNVDYLQTPVWAPDGGSVVVARSAQTGSPKTDVTLLRVPLEGAAESELATAPGVLGAYAIGFDAQGRFVHVVVDARGSTAYRDGAEMARLASGISRDWRLSPDGASLAFVETSTATGVKYYPRTVALDGGVTAQALAAADDTQALGVAWSPGSAQATFGREPGSSDAVMAQSMLSGGFDVPLAYARDGSALAVQHWSGSTFAQPGDGQLQLVGSDGSRQALEGFARFYGWATR